MFEGLCQVEILLFLVHFQMGFVGFLFDGLVVLLKMHCYKGIC